MENVDTTRRVDVLDTDQECDVSSVTRFEESLIRPCDWNEDWDTWDDIMRSDVEVRNQDTPLLCVARLEGYNYTVVSIL